MKQLIISLGFLALSSASATLNASIMTTDDMASFSFAAYNTLYDRDPGVDEEGGHYQSVLREVENLSLSRFNSSLGTLLDVAIWFESDWSLSSTVHSSDARNGNRRVSASGRSILNQRVRLVDPDREVTSNRERVRASCNDRPDCQESETESGSYNDAFDLGGFTLSDFIGLDPLDIRVIRTLTADLTACGNFDNCWQRNSNNAWNGQVHVNYTYNSVPEPSTLALMGMGLLGFAAKRLQRRKN